MDEVQARKLEKFSESVNSEVEEHISKILDEANEQRDKRLEKAEDDALLDAYNKIQKSVRDTEAKYRRMYALEEQKFRMDALRHREELSGKIFGDIEKKLAEFVSSEKYGDYLFRIAEGENLSGSGEIAVSPRDKAYGEKLGEKYGCEVKLDNSIELGGLMIIDKEQGMIIDKTFDSALEEQKKAFSSRYSFKTGN